MALDDVCKGIYVTTRLRSFINCRINQGRTSNWKNDFLMNCVFFNNILIQILRFAHFPVSNSKGKNSFPRHFNNFNLTYIPGLVSVSRTGDSPAARRLSDCQWPVQVPGILLYPVLSRETDR